MRYKKQLNFTKIQKMIKFNKTVLILEGEPTRAYEDLKRFCDLTGAVYNSLKQKKFPFLVNGVMLRKEKKGESFEYIERNGELIRIL